MYLNSIKIQKSSKQHAISCISQWREKMKLVKKRVRARLTQYSLSGKSLCFAPSSGEWDDVATISKAGWAGREELAASGSDPSSSELSLTLQLDKNWEGKTVKQWRKGSLHNQRVVWVPERCIWTSIYGCRWWKCVWDVWDVCAVSCLPYYWK